jgi:hypothetical protein
MGHVTEVVAGDDVQLAVGVEVRDRDGDWVAADRVILDGRERAAVIAEGGDPRLCRRCRRR